MTERFRKVFQEESDDCIMACVASVLGCELDDLPRLSNVHDDGSWYQTVERVLAERGKLRLFYWTNDPPFAPPGLAIASVYHERWYPRGHAVVCLDGAILHDPHPSQRAFVMGPRDIRHWLMFYPLVPNL